MKWSVSRPKITIGLVVFAIALSSFFGLRDKNVLADTTVTTIETLAGGITETSIVLGSDGFPRISYRDTSNADLKFVQCGNAACSSGNTITTVDGTGSVGGFSSLKLGTDGFPRISYYDAGNGDLKFVQCGNAACSSGNTITTVDSTGTVGIYTSLALGTDGFPRISYFDASNLDLKFVQCGDAACSSGNTFTTIDSTGVVGQESSLILGGDGFPRISYWDNTNTNLKFVQCGNAACSSGNTITTVDSTGDNGRFNSLKLGTDGFPRISYYDSTNTNLKFVQCGNAACSSGNTITTVDSTGVVGSYTSLALGSDEFPRISYQDTGNGDLKFVQCGNAACSSGNTITTVDSTGVVGSYTSLALGSDGYANISYVRTSSGDLKLARHTNVVLTSESLTGISDTMSRQKVSTDSNHEITFASTNGVSAGQTVTATFQSDFSIPAAFDFADADLAEGSSNNCSTAIFTEKTLGATASGATWGAVRTSSTVVTFTSGTGTITPDRCIRIRLGTNATNGGPGIHQITNATTVGSKTITLGGTMLDSGVFEVPITEDDQASNTAAFNPTIAFNIASQTSATPCDGTLSINGGTLTLGTLSTSSVTSSGVNSVSHICSRLSTNGASGAVLTITSSNAALKSTSVPADTIASATASPLVAGSEGYGICVGSGVTDTGVDTTIPASAMPTPTAPFGSSCTTSNHNVGVLNGTAQSLWTVNGPTSNAFARIYVKASISSTTPAHDDYADTFNFTMTGSF